MATETTLAGLLSQLASATGLTNLKMDDRGHAAITFNGRVTVHLHARTDDILLYTQLGTAEAEEREQVFSRLLRANFAWKQTGGATFSLTESGMIVLTTSLSVQELDFPRFHERLTSFAERAEYWRAELESASAESADSSDVIPDGLPTFAIRA